MTITFEVGDKIAILDEDSDEPEVYSVWSIEKEVENDDVVALLVGDNVRTTIRLVVGKGGKF